MRRREIIAGLLAAAAAGRVQAQQAGSTYRIAIVTPATPIAEIGENNRNPYVAQAYRRFFDELRGLGYVEGQNLVIDRYSGEGRLERFPALAAHVVDRKPDVIWTIGPQVLLAVKAATATIPVVALTDDPLGYGIVPSLARPGGNITGVSADPAVEGWAKPVQFLKEVVPTLSRLGFLVTRAVLVSRGAAVVREASEKLGLSLVPGPLDSPIDEAAFRRAFAIMAQEGVEGVYVAPGGETDAHARLIVDLAEKGHLPAIYGSRGYADVGGLMATTYDLFELVHHNALQIDRILKGANPGDIPFYQGTKFYLIINLKTAKALGLTIPASILAIADEVIE